MAEELKFLLLSTDRTFLARDMTNVMLRANRVCKAISKMRKRAASE